MFQTQWIYVSPFLPTVLIIPPLYLLLIILLNCCTYYLCLGSKATFFWALISTLFPYSPKSSRKSASQILAINVVFNSIVHAFLWAAMIGACSQCTFYLSLSQLSVAGPILLVLWILSIVTSIAHFVVNIKSSEQCGTTVKAERTYVVSTAF